MTAPGTEEVLRTFYDAFARRDAEAMAACYADHVVFSDPVFPELVGERARGMWRMLCGRAKDLKVTYRVLRADAAAGEVAWDAWYEFSATRRKVHNSIVGRFELEGGRIVRHVDRFDFWRWSRQALGPTGLVLGWTPLVRRKVQAQAAAGLDAFLKKAAAVTE